MRDWQPPFRRAAARHETIPLLSMGISLRLQGHDAGLQGQEAHMFADRRNNEWFCSYIFWPEEAALKRHETCTPIRQ